MFPTAEPNGKKRGRPRKADGDHGSEGRSHAYWSENGQFYFLGGWAWATELVETEPIDGGSRWKAVPLCLGKEEHIAPILKGDKPIPEGMHFRRRAAVEEILREEQSAGASEVRGRSL